MNFSTENFEKKNTFKKAAAIAHTKGTRDMFGRLLFLSLQRQIDIKSVFQYPLIPEPVCLAHPDGSIRDSPKSKVFHFLKTKVTSTPPTTMKTVIVDGMFMLRACIGKCKTYQALARRILQDSLKLTSYRVDICFDVYESLSIEDVERKVRGDEDSIRIFSIGPKHKIEGNIKGLFQLSNYKNELLRFLYKDYQDHIYAPLIDNKLFYCAINNLCMKFYSIDNVLKFEEVSDLFGSHAEADTRVMFHAAHADNHNPGNIVVRANDADILIVLLSNVHHLQNSQLCYDAGTDYDNHKGIC